MVAQLFAKRGCRMRIALMGLFSLTASIVSLLAGPAQAELNAADPRIAPPEIIIESQVPPEYPPAALKARFSGAVTLHVEVLSDGSVGSVEVIDSSSPNVGFEEAAVMAVRRWRFEPATRDGVPVDAKIKFRLTFRGAGAGSTKSPRVSAGSFSESGREDVRPPATPAPRPSSGGR